LFSLPQDLSAKELEAEQRTQALLVNELSELTSMLKESTLDINKAVNLQNIVSSNMCWNVLHALFGREAILRLHGHSFVFHFTKRI
jgi:hypothetical protein